MFEHPQHSALGIGLDFLITHMAVQLRLIETLDSGFTDRLRATVLDRIQFF